MATPQYATMQVAYRSGRRENFRVYCSDSAAAITYPDGAGSITFPEDAKIIDLVFAATLATTPTLTVNVGGQPKTVLNTATLAMASTTRILYNAPIYVPRGAALTIVQS